MIEAGTPLPMFTFINALAERTIARRVWVLFECYLFGRPNSLMHVYINTHHMINLRNQKCRFIHHSSQDILTSPIMCIAPFENLGHVSQGLPNLEIVARPKIG